MERMVASSEFECDVAIVGMGPVGATFAALLAGYGLSVFIGDKETRVYPLPRAAHFDHEVMRVFQQIGIADHLGDAITTGGEYRFVNSTGEVLLSFDLGQINLTGWRGYMIHQPGLERAIRRALDELSTIRTELGASFAGFDRSGRGVLSRWTVAGGDINVRSQFLVGCDGACSSVREQCGIELEDLGFDEHWLVLDVTGPDLSMLPPISMQVCDPVRPTTYVIMANNRRRWEFMLKPGETPEHMLRSETIEELLIPWGATGKVTIERSAVYRFHALVASQWSQEGVLLAGDAAHQMPPFAGQGMCSGIRDASALAWRLALIVRGRATGSLLASYQTEREPHVRVITQAAIETGRVVCTLDPAIAAARDAAMLEMVAAGAPQPDIASPPIKVAFGMPTAARAGEPFIQPWSREGAAVLRLDDVLGAGFWLISRKAVTVGPGGKLIGIRNFALDDEILAPFSSPLSAWLDVAEADAVLVRPDRYVFGTGNAADLENEAVSQIVREIAPAAQGSPNEHAVA
jgi:3-(3-hydroxy-phenyl)propionate hydroxylase